MPANRLSRIEKKEITSTGVMCKSGRDLVAILVCLRNVTALTAAGGLSICRYLIIKDRIPPLKVRNLFVQMEVRFFSFLSKLPVMTVWQVAHIAELRM